MATLAAKTLTTQIFYFKVTLGSFQDPGHMVATILYHYSGNSSSADIYVREHDEKEEDTMVPGPEIQVRGDFSTLQYTFFMDDARIAQVVSSKESGPQMYSLEVGPWVDIAFITICASSIDLLHVRASVSPLDQLLHCVSCCHSQDDEDEKDVGV